MESKTRNILVSAVAATTFLTGCGGDSDPSIKSMIEAELKSSAENGECAITLQEVEFLDETDDVPRDLVDSGTPAAVNGLRIFLNPTFLESRAQGKTQELISDTDLVVHEATHLCGGLNIFDTPVGVSNNQRIFGARGFSLVYERMAEGEYAYNQKLGVLEEGFATLYSHYEQGIDLSRPEIVNTITGDPNFAGSVNYLFSAHSLGRHLHQSGVSIDQAKEMHVKGQVIKLMNLVYTNESDLESTQGLDNFANFQIDVYSGAYLGSYQNYNTAP